jgi:hypothetical protein
MPISSKVDITKIQYVVNSIASRNSLVFKKNYTVNVIPKDLSNGKPLYENIYSELLRLYPQLKLKKEIDGSVGKIRVTENGYGYIKIQLEKSKNISSGILKPGEPYELYFHSVILDALTDLKELREEMDVPPQIFDMYNNVTLNLYGGGKKISIGPIKSADKVGQTGQKPDILIKTKSGKNVTISLKQGNFSFWSSADTYQNVPKKILENTLSSGLVSLQSSPGQSIVFANNVGGIRVPATIDEIKKYCFGGPTGVDYIVINAKLTGVSRNIISMNGLNIFKNNNSGDIMRLIPDVYLVIKKDLRRNASAMLPYKGLTVSFVNRAHAFDPRNRYVDGVR